jgi:hypothetical protein
MKEVLKTLPPFDINPLSISRTLSAFSNSTFTSIDILAKNQINEPSDGELRNTSRWLHEFNTIGLVSKIGGNVMHYQIINKDLVDRFHNLLTVVLMPPTGQGIRTKTEAVDLIIDRLHAHRVQPTEVLIQWLAEKIIIENTDLKDISISQHLVRLLLSYKTSL